MKIVTAFCIMATIILTAGCGDSAAARKEGELYGKCFADETCKEGLACDTDHNICIKDRKSDAGDQEMTDADSGTSDADNGTSDADNETSDVDADAGETDDAEESGIWQDPHTGLIWSERYSVSHLPELKDVLEFCDGLVEDGFSDWKMPTIDELRTLVQNCKNMEPHGICEISEEAGKLSWYDDLDIFLCNCEWKDGWQQVTEDGEIIYDNGGYYSKLGDDQDVILYSSSKSDYGGDLWCISFGIADMSICSQKSVNSVLNPDHFASVRCVGSYSRQQPCEGLDENASWNVYSSIPQRWDGSSWQPGAAGVYNEKPSDAECRFVCNPGYKWDGSKCTLHDLKDISECSHESPTPCYDSSSGLVWSAKAPYEMLHYDALDYCDNLVEGGLGGWHLPTISELRTLIQNCRWTVTGGDCRITDDCLSSTACEYSYSQCGNDCNSTSSNGGIYVIYSRFGDEGDFLSSSKVADYPDDVWGVNFDKAQIRAFGTDEVYHKASLRCVKSKQVRRECTGLPENALWNSVSSILQTCDETSCQPSKVGVYNETPSENECRFKCYPGYEWDGSKCNLTNPEALSECGPESPMPCMDHSSGLVWSSKTSTSWDMLDAEDYCENLTEGGISDWHLPTISELRTLIVDCPATEPGGECGVTDDCLSKEECLTEKICSCGYNDNHIKFGYEGYYLLSSSRNGEIYHGAEGDYERVWCVYCSYAKIKECSLMWPDLNFHCVR